MSFKQLVVSKDSFNQSELSNSILNTPPKYLLNITVEKIEAHPEEFINKSVKQITALLSNNGYEFKVRNSKYKNSTAEIIEITNPTKERNITQIQVSPHGSNRHGNIPYVKISTSDIGIIKIINGTPKEYLTDGNEKARLIFIRQYKNADSPENL